MTKQLLDKRFVAVTGKGGVGRTVVSLIIGHAASRRGKRVLVCLCNAPSRYSDLVGGLVIDDSIRSVSGRLDIVNLEPRASREEYGLAILKNRLLHRLIFGSRVVRAFLDAVPGLSEWAILGKATFHALERTPDGEYIYDLVILDSPTTGHALDILALPRAIASSVPAGRISEEARQRLDLMEDPNMCEVVPVTVPEEIPVNECIELVESVLKLGLPVERVVVNMVSKFDRPFLERIRRELAGNEAEPQSWLLPAAIVSGRERDQEENIERLGSMVPLPRIELPLVAGGYLDEAPLLGLVEEFESGLEMVEQER